MGPKPIITDREARLVVRAANTGDYTARQLHDAFSLKCSVRTVQRLLQRVDHLVYTKMDRTLPLDAAHMAARLEWSEKMVLFTQWTNTIYSDEKKFNLDGPDGYKTYWHDLRLPRREYVKRQFGGGSIMVWAGISSKGKTSLVILEGTQASSNYIWTLSENLLPFAHLHYGTDFVFQQDNASIHTSNETKEFMAEQSIEVMQWPARSPDFNPIENVWSKMSSIMYANARQYHSKEELKVAVLAAWEQISQDYIDNLIASMPRRCIEGIKLRGKKTHY
ncbi:hypothetical protein ATCC90586_011006 [Pythium insidiosum]|nr:hypothetical protein ATCC90586_011006 [Pythium insidiosum]